MAPRKADVGRNRSGRHISPVIRLVCPAEAVALIDQAAGECGESRSELLRRVLAVAVAKQLGVDEADTVARFGALRNWKRQVE